MGERHQHQPSLRQLGSYALWGFPTQDHRAGRTWCPDHDSRGKLGFLLPAQGHRAGPGALIMALTVSWDFCSRPRIIKQEGPGSPVMALRVNRDFCSIWHHCGWATHTSARLCRGSQGSRAKPDKEIVEATLLTSWGPGARDTSPSCSCHG